ncbi:hypothetical protein H1R20_g1335, partial [Candolleomyces eurysporus]
MTLAIYTKTKIDSNYLITYVQIYFVITSEVKIRLESFIPTSSAELVAAVALLDQKYSSQAPEVLQHLWTLASPEPISLIRSASSSVDILPDNRTPVDLRLTECK